MYVEDSSNIPAPLGPLGAAKSDSLSTMLGVASEKQPDVNQNKTH